MVVAFFAALGVVDGLIRLGARTLCVLAWVFMAPLPVFVVKVAPGLGGMLSSIWVLGVIIRAAFWVRAVAWGTWCWCRAAWGVDGVGPLLLPLGGSGQSGACGRGGRHLVWLVVEGSDLVVRTVLDVGAWASS